MLTSQKAKGRGPEDKVTMDGGKATSNKKCSRCLIFYLSYPPRIRENCKRLRSRNLTWSAVCFEICGMSKSPSLPRKKVLIQSSFLAFPDAKGPNLVSFDACPVAVGYVFLAKAGQRKSTSDPINNISLKNMNFVRKSRN